MMDPYKFSRVYADAPLMKGADHIVSESIHHYLKNVMRLEEGAHVRIFNGRDGEFLGVVTESSKKRTVLNLEERLKDQQRVHRHIHLLFAPIKKERMEWLIEKSVELGATNFHPILTQNTDIRKINTEKITAQIIEAAEQCERMDIPVLHPPQDLWKFLAGWNSGIPILAAIERVEAKPLSAVLPKGDVAFLIGPAGGFTAEEKDRLSQMENIIPISLGSNILRAETAAIAALSSLIV